MSKGILLPSPQTTLVILIGASAWPLSPDFEKSEAFANSAQGMVEYFLDPHLFNLPKENLLNLFDSNQSPDDIDIAIGQFLDERTLKLGEFGSSVRDLIVYFTGHGGFADGGSSLYLAIRRTRQANRIASSIPITSLAHTLREKARHLRRTIILDCCFSGAAFTVFQGQDLAQAAITQTIAAFKTYSKGKGVPKKGTSLLCSSGSRVPSVIYPGEKFTAFSSALLYALNNGTAHQQGNMPLRIVGELVEHFLSTTYGGGTPKPEIHSPDQSEGDVAAVPFFPNISEKERPYFFGEQLSIFEQQLELLEQVQQYGDISLVAPKSIRRLIDEGEALVRAKQYREALTIFDLALLLEPKNASIYSCKAKVLEHLNQLTEALDQYEQAISIEPGKDYFYLMKICVLQKLKRDNEALVTCNKLIHINPKEHSHFLKKIEILVNLERYEEALSVTEQVLSFCPDPIGLYIPKKDLMTYSKTYMQKGDLLKHLGRTEEAQQAYKEAMRFFYGPFPSMWG